MNLLKYVLMTILTVMTAFIVYAWLFPACACSPKWKAYRAAAKSDLNNLVIAEEQHYERDTTYSANLDSVGMAPSPGVVIEIVEATRDGWSAVARHQQASGDCRIFVGRVRQVPRIAGVAVLEGAASCDIRQQ